MAIENPQIPLCTPQNPMMKLGNGDNAPVLNYELPQNTTFSSYGTIPLPISADLFNDKAKEIPKHGKPLCRKTKLKYLPNSNKTQKVW